VPAGVRAQLAALGVTTLEQSEVCTMESSDHFSYRREKVTGRLASYVWLEGN
jgi:copper oxidase (laccase) domain-containing protein